MNVCASMCMRDAVCAAERGEGGEGSAPGQPTPSAIAGTNVSNGAICAQHFRPWPQRHSEERDDPAATSDEEIVPVNRMGGEGTVAGRKRGQEGVCAMSACVESELFAQGRNEMRAKLMRKRVKIVMAGAVRGVHGCVGCAGCIALARRRAQQGRIQ